MTALIPKREIRKISRRGSRSPNHAELGYLQGTPKKCTKTYNARAQPLPVVLTIPIVW